MKRKSFLAVIGAISVLLAACGGGEKDSTQQEDSSNEKLGGVFDVKEDEEQKQDENFIVVDLTMDNVNDYIDFVEYNNSYAIISKQFVNGLVFWDYSGDFKLSYKYTLEVEGEQIESNSNILDLTFNYCIESNSKPIITNIKGSITYINADNENVKCEYDTNSRYVEVDEAGHGETIDNKELFEMYPY